MVKGEISYQSIQGHPDPGIMDQILELYNLLFDDADSEFFINRLKDKKDLYMALAFFEKELVGLKIGYRVDAEIFYSWIGGVKPSYRRRGIANQLAELQEKFAVSRGYRLLKTKSMNRFKPMMILNLKRGFEIRKVYTNPSEQTKIVFFKTID